MMLKEFERLTGVYPSSDLYAMIERAYSDFNGSKEEFCAAYKANKDGLAEKIQQDAECYMVSKLHCSSVINEKTQDQLAAAEKKIKGLEAENERLQEKINKLLEWKFVGVESGMSDDDYKELANRGEPISDERAKDIIFNEFGFIKDSIVIVKELHEWEKNVLGKYRSCGKVARLPHYESSDWNYIRFDVHGRCYELINGDLSLYQE